MNRLISLLVDKFKNDKTMPLDMDNIAKRQKEVLS